MMVAHRGAQYHIAQCWELAQELRSKWLRPGQLPIWHGDSLRRRRTGIRRTGRARDNRPAKYVEWFVHAHARNMRGAPSRRPSLVAIAGLAAFARQRGACAHQDYFPGTTILRSERISKIIETVEQYRRRLVERNVDGLLVLASQPYFEDSGTPRSDDDYGYEGLKQVLSTKLSRVKSLRYEIEYRNIRVTGKQAEVEVFLDGSFELAGGDAGDRYRRVNDYHRFVLDQEDDRWKFVSRHVSRGALLAVALDSLEQASEVERLHHQLRGVDQHRAVAGGGDDDERDVGDLGVLLLLPPELPAVHHRHHEVEQDDAGAGRGRLQVVEGLAAVPHARDVVALVLENLTQRVADVRIVVDDQNTPARFRALHAVP